MVESNHPVAALGDSGFGPLDAHATNRVPGKGILMLLRAVESYDAELVVLARYMQVLSDETCKALHGRAINIHHSFLPGFKGARPYHQAYRRGVKLVGATDWFIRLPFMLEGLLHGIIGGGLASIGLYAWNTQWTNGVKAFPEGSGFAALVVTDGYDRTVMLIMLAIGAVAGAIGAGIAASRFLDV